MPLVAANHPNWKTFVNEVGQDVLFSQLSYARNNKSVQEDLEALADYSGPNYQMLMMSNYVDDIKGNEYRCVCFIDYAAKKIVFANCGTRFEASAQGLSDLYSDALLGLHNSPLKIEQASVMNDMIIDSLGDEIKDYQFHYTGHSLGAAMAEIQAVDMDIKLQKKGLRKNDLQQISAITFENPGTKPILEKIYKNENMDPSRVSKMQFVTFCNRSNVINSANEQAGNVMEIIPASQNKKNTSNFQLFFEYCARLTQSVPIVSRAFKVIAHGLLDFPQLLEDHKLENFHETFVQRKGLVHARQQDVISLEEASSGLKLVKFDQEIATEITTLRTKNLPSKHLPSKHKYIMQKINDFGEVTLLSFSNAELGQAMRNLSVKKEKNTGEGLLQQIIEKKEKIDPLSIPTCSQIYASERRK